MNHANKLTLSIVAIFLISLFAIPAHAADKGMKIGVINVQKVISLSEIGKEARDAVKAKFEEYQAKLRKEEESLMVMKDEIDKKGSVWSEETRINKQREFERRVKALEDESKYATNDMKEFEKKKVEPILKELESIIDDFGKDQGYSLIMDSARGVIFANEALDISASVAAELDKRKTGK